MAELTVLRVEAGSNLWVPYGIVPVLTAIDKVEVGTELLWQPVLSKKCHDAADVAVSQCLSSAHSAHLSRNSGHDMFKTAHQQYGKFLA